VYRKKILQAEREAEPPPPHYVCRQQVQAGTWHEEDILLKVCGVLRQACQAGVPGRRSCARRRRSVSTVASARLRFKTAAVFRVTCRAVTCRFRCPLCASVARRRPRNAAGFAQRACRKRSARATASARREEGMREGAAEIRDGSRKRRLSPAVGFMKHAIQMLNARLHSGRV